MPKGQLVLQLAGQFLLGLGVGMGWGHQLTPYPALVGTVLCIAGGVANLAAVLVVLRTSKK